MEFIVLINWDIINILNYVERIFITKKQDLIEIQQSMDNLIPFIIKGFSLEEAAVELELNPSIVKKWYDKGWHKEGDIYIDFFKKVRAIKYSKSPKFGSKSTASDKTYEKKLLRKVNEFLESQNCYIDNSMRRKIKNKLNRRNNYYSKLKIRHLIDNHNNNFIDKEKIIISEKFNSFLNSHNRFIDDHDKKLLKDNYHKKYFNYYEKFNMENSIKKHNSKFISFEKKIILDEFNDFLNSHDEFIDDSIKKSLEKKYNKTYNNYFSDLKMSDSINDFNERFIENEKKMILVEFEEFLNSQELFIDESTRKSFKRKFKKDYYNYYTKLNMNELINEYNNNFIEYFKKELKDDYITNSEKLELINSLNYNFDITTLIDDHNEEYIDKTAKLNRSYFDNIAGKSLDNDQIRAVLTDDDVTQIVAGAGTGKTLTLQAKIKYLIEKKGISPSDILCISFSNSACDDLSKKLEKTLGKNIIDVRTFHSIGYKILGMNDEHRDVPNDQIEELIDSFFKEVIVEKPSLVKEIIEFFSYYYDIPYLDQYNLELQTLKHKVNKLDEYDEYLKEHFNIQIDDEKEFVNSVQELIVANYLFIHNIPYEVKMASIYKSDVEENEFLSDIYLPENDIYINLNLNSQNMNITNKKIINLSFNNDVDTILNILEKNLIKFGVTIKELDYIDLFNLLFVNKNISDYKRFISTVETFINLFKGNAENKDDYGNDISKSKFAQYQEINSKKYTGSIEKRNKFFLSIIQEIYEIYTQSLEDYGYIDFNDMINDAVIALRKGAFIHNYKYIIVDEYQDTSHTRYNLLKEMQNSTGAKLVVVGDDWQSIYGFTGCDVSLFSNFDKYFNNPKMVKIQVTYRNSQDLIDVMGDFILKNKNQIPKQLRSAIKLTKKPIKLVGNVSRAEKVLSLINILDVISQKNKDAEILILGRNNNDKYEIACKEIFTFLDEKDSTKIIYENNPNLNVEFRTIHKSKGLEADYVIVLNLTDKLNGFPNKMINDSVLDFVSTDYNENIEFPEERRLFYVALTRTRNDVYLLHNELSPSIFINDIEDNEKVKNLKFIFSNEEIHNMNLLLEHEFEVIDTKLTCPKCNSGSIKLIVNNKKGTSGFKCSNVCGWDGGAYHNINKGERSRKIAYLKYAEVCPLCHHMVVVTPRKKDPRKKFMGCNHFPNCKFAHGLPNDFMDIDKQISNLNKTINNVFYLYDYVPKEKLSNAVLEDIENNEKILDFKDGDDESIIGVFTNELMESITFIANNKMTDEIKNISLVSVPSSKVSNNKKSTMRRTINILEKWSKNGIAEHNFGCKQNIIGQKDMLKRVIDVPTAHLGEGRANCKQHVQSIKCDETPILSDDTVYIILDDITTTGASMKACKQILINNGVNEENIHALAIGATVRGAK